MLLNEKKEIIIGSAINYNYRDLYFFVASLRKNYKDKILFFVSQSIDNETLAFFKKFNISLIKTKLNPKLIFKYRYKLYLNYLKKNKYNKVMITDTRDVIFQKNPFKDKNFFELCFFQEDKKIYECEFNTNWLISLYGKKIYYKFKNNKIICSGTTIGKYKNIIDYLKKISTEIKKTEIKSDIANKLKKKESLIKILVKLTKFVLGKKKYFYLKTKFFGNHGQVGTDQGNHNYLIHSKKIKDFKIYGNEAGYVATIGNANLSKYYINKGIYNSRGIKFSVVHQYDRILQKKIPMPNDIFEKKFRKYLNKI